MALKAGYVGVKRWIFEKIAKKAENALPTNVFSDMGARNMLKNTLTSGTTHQVVRVINADGSISLTGTADANTTMNINSFTGAQVKALGSKLRLTGGKSSNAYLSFRSSDWSLNMKDLGSGVIIDTSDLTDAATYYVSLVIANGFKTDGITVYPMLKNINDLFNEYAPYAMTNQQLTGSADEQKAAINAIITAATEAADFAAFKTAMAAITPVTRSAAPDTREASPEVIEEDLEPVTKKSTKKTTTKEGE